jgi:PIN domain nuclease of toxin-antitoxin system
MRLLLDTHALLWWLAGDDRLTRAARSGIQSSHNAVLVSAASAWEIATKHRLGKLDGSAIADGLAPVLISQNFQPLDITLEHAERAGTLAGAHTDPFDRMLIAQAQAERLTLVSNELAFDDYGVARLW